MMECRRLKFGLLVIIILLQSVLGLEGHHSLDEKSQNKDLTGRRTRSGKDFSVSGGGKSQGRKGKQFFVPFVAAWPYQQYQQQQQYQLYQHPLGYFLLPQAYQQNQHSQYPYQYNQLQYQFQQQQTPQYQQQSTQAYHHPQQQQQISIRKESDNDQQMTPPNASVSMNNMMYHHRRDVPPVISVHSADSILSRTQEEAVAVIPPPPPQNGENQPPSSVAVPVHFPAKPCRTSNGRLGTCQTFSKCFPMVEIEYGRGLGDGDLLTGSSPPLVEQLLQNTNASVCSQDVDHTSREVCCPRSDDHLKLGAAVAYRVERVQKTNGLGGGSVYQVDREVALPSITQRPPLIKTVVSRQLIESKMCGHSKSNNKYGKGGGGIAIPKITGGVEATGPKEFPWMAAVFGKNQKIFCGASLITDRFLLTAAHCFSTFAPADIQHLYVHLGDFNLRTTFDGRHEVRKIDKIIINKGFKIQTYKNDIALLKLDRPLNFTDRIQPICLPEPTTDLFEKRQLVVTGWGRKFRYGVTSDTLRKVEMPVWNFAECSKVYETFAPGRLLDSNICAGDGKRNKDACLGDSGGPAIYNDGRKWVQIGITSWGKGCGNFPGVYTRVDKYLMWITKNLEQYQ